MRTKKSPKRASQSHAAHNIAAQRATLQEISTAVRQELNSLSIWPWLVRQQISNRLQWSGEPLTRSLVEDLNRRIASGARPRLHVKFPFRESPAISRTLEGHTRPVEDCHVTPDGQLVISASRDGTIRLWDLETGEQRGILVEQSLPIMRCAINPDGRHLVSIAEEESDGTNELTIWDLNSRLPITTLTFNPEEISECVISSDSRFVVFAQDQTLRVWDLVRATERPSMRSLRGGVCALAAHPTGKLVVSGNGDGSITVWNLERGREKFTLESDDGYIGACAVSANGQFVVAATPENLTVWDLKSRKRSLTLKGHTGRVLACAVTSDSLRIVSASVDKSLKVWDAVTGAVQLTLSGHSGEVRACAVTPDGKRVVSASDDKTLKIWDISVVEDKPSPGIEHVDTVRTCGFTSDGKLALSAAADKTIKLWDLETAQVRLTLQTGSSQARCVISSDNSFIVSAGYKNIRLWNVATGAVRAKLSGHSDWITACRISPDCSLIVSTGWDKTLVFWDSASRQKIISIAAHTGHVNDCAISPDSSFVVSASSDETLKVWDLFTCEQRVAFSKHKGAVMACAISPDATFAASASWHELKTWDPSSAAELQTFTRNSALIWDCAISPDAMMLASVSDDRTLRLWSRSTGNELACLPLPATPYCVEFHPSKPMVLCGDAAGGVYPIDLVGIEYEPLFVTPILHAGALMLRCPSCLSVFPIEQRLRGKPITCPNAGCTQQLIVNRFVVSAADPSGSRSGA